MTDDEFQEALDQVRAREFDYYYLGVDAQFGDD